MSASCWYIRLLSLLVFVETQSWMKRLDDDECEDKCLTEIKGAIEDIFRYFMGPLEILDVNLSSLQDEVEDAVD